MKSLEDRLKEAKIQYFNDLRKKFKQEFETLESMGFVLDESINDEICFNKMASGQMEVDIEVQLDKFGSWAIFAYRDQEPYWEESVLCESFDHVLELIRIYEKIRVIETKYEVTVYHLSIHEPDDIEAILEDCDVVVKQVKKI